MKDSGRANTDNDLGRGKLNKESKKIKKENGSSTDNDANRLEIAIEESVENSREKITSSTDILTENEKVTSPSADTETDDNERANKY